MEKSESTRLIRLEPDDHHRLSILCGPLDENLHFMEAHLGVEINNRGNEFEIIGIPKTVDKACEAINKLYEITAEKKEISTNDVLLLLKELEAYPVHKKPKKPLSDLKLKIGKSVVKARTANQRHYLYCMNNFDINFGIGPSGTGKTFLAAAAALEALEKENVQRIVLVRPAVEAGESLGFLPGDMAQKVDPYLRPLYDALYEISGIEKVTYLINKGKIEIAPLAFMRGRTLNDSFVILDEGQNSTVEQMKMFLTRIGFGSKAVITGDITQSDLPKKTLSGLRHAITVLKNVESIQFCFFKSNDVVRHPIVQKIIDAYEMHGA